MGMQKKIPYWFSGVWSVKIPLAVEHARIFVLRDEQALTQRILTLGIALTL